ncbi:MAG TPA: pitrilysin family protein [Planctomycetota bacterium]|jgi:predicted Zn-dependent peptidase
MFRKLWLASLLLSGATACVYAADDFAEIQSKIVCFTLDNGLTVILYPRGDAPVISCVTYVKAGSVNEHVGITGIAHQLEHLAFKGTASIGTKDYAAEKPLFVEIDKLYAVIQEIEQRMPAEVREAFLSLLAKLTSTGGAAALAKLDADLAALQPAWEKVGFKLKDEEKAALAAQVKAYAEKVNSAEKFVEQNQYSNLIDRNGGVGLNAFTSDDRTVYHVSIPANKLELWAALESDRFMNLVPRQLEKEKQVVLEERRMRSDSEGFGKLYEAFLSVAFTAHPYGVPVIGWRSDILGYTRGKIERFYQSQYRPSNTIVSIAGDIDIEKTKKIVADYFGKLPKAAAPERPLTVEPPQEGERRVEVEFPTQPALLIGYHIPERNHPDTPALEMMEEIATSGRTSRFYSHLVKTGKANSVGSWIGPGSLYPRLLFISGEPPKGVSTEELEAGIFAEVEKLKAEPPTADEMKRVLTRYRASVLRGLKSNLGLAQELADYQALSGDWHNLFRDIQRMSAVTPEQVTAVASKYLTKQNRTVGRVVSTSGAQEAPGAESIFGMPVK